MTSAPTGETSKAETSTSLCPLKQMDAGLLSVGYTEAGPADSPAGP
jgi:hypothetical protein